MNVSGRAKSTVSAPPLHFTRTRDRKLRSTQGLQNSRATRPESCLSLKHIVAKAKNISPLPSFLLFPLWLQNNKKWLGSDVTLSLSLPAGLAHSDYI